jgi:diguanylate cyclase (GGDEF)-like protein
MTIQAKRLLPFPISILSIYVLFGLCFLTAGLWLAHDLGVSRASIVSERMALALQTSKFMSQRFGTTILTTDFVLRDLTTRTTPEDLDLARKSPDVEYRLSLLARQKLATLPEVTGIGLLDRRAVFVAAADRRLIGIKSNSFLSTVAGNSIEDRAYVDYVPSAKSADKQPSILVSRPIPASDGRYAGGALAAIGLKFAQDWIESLALGPNDTLALVDDQGTLLAHNPPRPELVGKELKYPTGAPSLGVQRDSASFISDSPMDGRERIYGLSKADTIPLTILVGFDMDRTLHEWRQRVRLFIMGAAILLVLIGIVFFMHWQTLRQKELLREMAIVDPLTGIANRRHLTTSGTKEMEKASRYHHPASLLMVDIDRFKTINDTWGHPAGDRVIQALAKAMVETVRATDLVGRIGGEEFVAVLTGTDAQGASVLADRLRERIETATPVDSDEGTPIRFTISIGVASQSDETRTFDQVLKRADQALYEAKRQGRNRVVLS